MKLHEQPNYKKMTTLGLIDFKIVEKYVMLFITRNSGSLCTIQHIYNDILDDLDIKNPEIKNDLKIKLHFVMSQLDSNQKNVTVVKKGESYLVGYNMPNNYFVELNQSSSFPTNDTVKTDNIINTDNLAKTMFEYIVDNDINYPIKCDCNGENLLFIGVSLNDTIRVNKLVTKYSMSFFDKNKDGKSVFDLIPESPMLKYCILENNKQIKNLKKDVKDLSSSLVDISRDLELKNKEILNLKKMNDNKNILDTILLTAILASIYFKLFL